MLEFRALPRLLLAVLLSMAVAFQPAAAQRALRDAETEALFRDISRPIIAAAGLRPENVSFVLIQDDSINAFVAGGQIVYMHSGLVTAADDYNELQGVIAHELGHVVGGHVIRYGEGVRQATGMMILSMILGAAAMAAGSGEAGTGIMAAGQQAAMGKFLAFSRTQESSADQAGARFLNVAGIPGRGSVSFFRKLQNQEFRYAMPQDDEAGYNRTHPLSGDRVQMLENVYQKVPAWTAPLDPAMQARFLRVKAKLAGFVSPTQTLGREVARGNSVPARYARAYAWHGAKYPDRALVEIDKLLAEAPRDPYFLELKGQILLESGRPADAVTPLRQAAATAPGEPLIATLLAHALVATEDRANYPEARRLLTNAVGRDRDNSFAWYQLGVVYEREGDGARAALATAERHSLEGNPRYALASARIAVGALPQGTPDWLRAQDILMVSEAAVEKEKKDRKRGRGAEREGGLTFTAGSR